MDSHGIARCVLGNLRRRRTSRRIAATSEHGCMGRFAVAILPEREPRVYARQRFLKRASMIVLALGFTSTVVSGATLLLGRHPPLVNYALTVPLALAAMFSALTNHYLERESIEVDARRYERMFHVFDKARADLGTVRREPARIGEHPGRLRTSRAHRARRLAHHAP